MKRLLYFSMKIVLLCMGILGLTIMQENFRIETLAADGEKTVKVGFPIQAGLSMRDENGNLSGYTYDYIMEISQYTGWDYEFVFFEGNLNEQLVQAMEELKLGEIDLLGAMYYDESLTADYLYPGYCYGINYSGLFVPENSSLREASLYNSGNIKVGVHNKAGNKNIRLEQFAQMNNLPIEQVVATLSSDYYGMLEDGRVDALLSTDVTMAARENMYAIAHFSPIPFYFATTKGNTEIVRQLDYALSTIDQVNPDFMVQLYNQYFSKSPTNISFTEEELDYLKNCGTLEVVMYENKPPFQSLDPKTNKPVGITVEVLEYIAEKMELKLHYNTVSTYKEYIEFIESGKADIAADVFSNYQDARDTKSALTLPWYTLPMTMVFREGINYSETGKIAAPYFLKNILPSKDNVLFFDTVEECLQAVQSGIANYSYIGEFCSQYYFNMPEYGNLKRMNQSEIANQKLCFGIYNTNSPYLHTIFNKVITTLPKDTMDEIVYRNTYQQQELSLIDLVKRNRNLLFAFVMTLLALILAVCIYIKSRQQDRIRFENQRYNAISNLANEYFYEYDIFRDELSLSEKCADYFACKQQIGEFSKILSKLTEEENKGIWQLGKYIISKEEGSFEQPCDMPDHTRQWFKILSSAIYNNKKQVLFVGKITNIQEVKLEQLHLQKQASLDGLTGVYNISSFKQIVCDQLLKFEAHIPCALMILDIDNFKQINDRFGHYSGDVVLTSTAKLVSDSITHGIFGRLGGDEFVAFITDADKTMLESQCTKICETMMKETKSLLDMEFTVSIGIAWAREGQSYEDLYQEADAALYQTKTTTKNGFSFSDDGK